MSKFIWILLAVLAIAIIWVSTSPMPVIKSAESVKAEQEFEKRALNPDDIHAQNRERLRNQ